MAKDEVIGLVKALAAAVGWINTLIGVAFFSLCFLLYKMVMHLLSEKQKQIDALATENREYRERFTSLMDEHRLSRKPIEKKGD